MEFKGFRKGPTLFGYFISGLSGAVLGVFLILTLGPATLFTKFQQQTAVQQPVEQPAPQDEAPVMQGSGESGISVAVSRTVSSVVGIRTTRINKNYFQNKKLEGAGGSGIILDTEGYILTSSQTANKTSRDVMVSLNNGKEVEGKVVWSDQELDLSVIKITSLDLKAAVLGDSMKVNVGDQAVVVGNQAGLSFQRTAAAGVINGVNRSIFIAEDKLMEGLLQTDAVIGQGSSGGPLINIKGEVIGMITTKVSSYDRLGFAVPINIVKPILQNIKETANFAAPVIDFKGFDREMSGFYDNKSIEKGIYIYEVKKGGIAEAAGLDKGDIILTANGEEVNTLIGLREIFYKAGTGSTVKLRVRKPLGNEEVLDFNLK